MNDYINKELDRVFSLPRVRRARSIDLLPGYVEDPDFGGYMESDDTFHKRILELVRLFMKQ